MSIDEEGLLPANSASCDGEHDNTLLVCTLNLRRADAEAADSLNSWKPHRLQRIVQWVAARRPAVLGVQEAFGSMVRDITSAVELQHGTECSAGAGTQTLLQPAPLYEWVGEGRLGGEGDDAMGVGNERCAILFDTTQLALDGGAEASGTRWLSPSPTTVASIGWGAACPRVFTWARLRIRNFKQRGHGSKDQAPLLLVSNCHLDHCSVEARQRGSEVIAAHLREHAHQHKVGAVLLLGDFNCTRASTLWRWWVQHVRKGKECADGSVIESSGAVTLSADREGTCSGCSEPGRRWRCPESTTGELKFHDAWLTSPASSRDSGGATTTFHMYRGLHVERPLWRLALDCFFAISPMGAHCSSSCPSCGAESRATRCDACCCALCRWSECLRACFPCCAAQSCCCCSKRQSNRHEHHLDWILYCNVAGSNEAGVGSASGTLTGTCTTALRTLVLQPRECAIDSSAGILSDHWPVICRFELCG